MKISNETRVGILASFAIVIVILGINFLKGKSVFSRDVYFYAKFHDVEGLAASNPVILYGVKIGQVDKLTFLKSNPIDTVQRYNLEIQLRALNQKLSASQGPAQKDSIQKQIETCTRSLDHYTQRVEVKFHVYNDVEFPANSVAKINSDLLGSKTLEIVPGNAISVAKANDTLAGLVEPSLPEALSKTVSPIKDKVETLVSSIDTVVNSLNDVFNDKTKNDLKGSFAAIRPTVQNIEEATAKLNAFVGDETGRMHDIMANIDKITHDFTMYHTALSRGIDNFASISDTLRAMNLKKTITETTTAISSVNDILQKVKSGDGTLGKLVSDDKLYNNLVSATRNMDKLVSDIKANPHKYFAPLGKRGKPEVYKIDTAR